MDIINQLQIEKLDSLDEDEIVKAISLRVSNLLETDPELLMSYLYRLDVSESLVQNALHQDDVSMALSRLIWDRQKVRYQTKRDVHVKKPEDLEGLEW